MHFEDALVVLAAAIISVSLLQRFGVSSLLGYLIAGMAIGPHALGLFRDTATAETLSELGVLFLLFTIGLDLPLQRLRTIWRQVFGLGLGQVAVTSVAFGGAAYLLGLPVEAALIVGGALAFSSTAAGLQLLAEQGELSTRTGRTSLAILLFQDLAVVPLLALVPLLAGDRTGIATALLLALGKAVLALLAVVVLGRLALAPLYRLIAATRNHEIVATTTLFVVLGAGWATAQVGMSMALGAFLAGLIMAETEFRHQVEADIRPFRGLFLGLFFVTVGMLIDTGLVARHLPAVLGLTVGLLVAKALIVLALCRVAGLKLDVAVRVALLLAPCGEFAFILFGLASQLGVLTGELGQILIATVAATMMLAPLCAALGRRLGRVLEPAAPDDGQRLRDEAHDLKRHVVIAGYGRVGQVVAGVLAAHDIPYLAIDRDMRTVSEARRRGLPVFYGDSSRAEVLEAAGIERSIGLAVTLDHAEAAEGLVTVLRQHHPDIPIVARSRDGVLAATLDRLGTTAVILEALEPALQIAGEMLRLTGVPSDAIDRSIETFRRRRPGESENAA